MAKIEKFEGMRLRNRFWFMVSRFWLKGTNNQKLINHKPET